jgi:hypothetical protein
MGGLGNQMFQIAHTYSQSLRYGVKCIFPKKSNTQNQGNDISKYVSNVFNKFIFSDGVNFDLIIREQNFGFTSINIPENKSVLFSGYYQSNKNFYGFDSNVKDMLIPDKHFIEYSSYKYPSLLDESSVSIHIRRGDYLNYPLVHPVISLDYLKKSISYFNPNSKFLIFSDDKEWVSKNIDFIQYEMIEFNHDYEELWAMSLCKNNILSNSSFSWWAAFLNQNENKKIISPKKWFGDLGPKNYQDIYINDWISIEN